ncbi:MAG: MFS transporter [Lachnospiraceae bacterium]
MIQKKYLPSAFILYISYFVHGIGVSIMGQYKPELAAQWNTGTLADGSIDVSSVIMVSAALGLGRLISLPVSGWMSDKYGRRPTALLGVLSYIVYFLGIVFSPNMYIAYAMAIFGGVANSFLDTGVIPACMEILVGKSGLASMLTKFFMSGGQFALPFMMGIVATRNMSYRSLFLLMAIIMIILAVLIVFMPMPKFIRQSKTDTDNKSSSKMKFSAEAIAIILIGFTSTSTFQLWLNCNQEFAELCGVANPSQIQSYYSIGSILAVIITALLVSKIKAVRFLFLYPLAAVITLILALIIQTPTICVIAGFLVGFFAAGGVLQLANATVNDMFPNARGKITSIIMIASSLANYTVLSLASVLSNKGGAQGPKYVIILNIAITIIGILLSLFVNYKYNRTLVPEKAQ